MFQARKNRLNRNKTPAFVDTKVIMSDKPLIQNLGQAVGEPVTEAKKPKKPKVAPIDWEMFDNINIIVSKIIKKKPKMKKFKEGIERINEIIEEENDLNFVI